MWGHIESFQGSWYEMNFYETYQVRVYDFSQKSWVCSQPLRNKSCVNM